MRSERGWIEELRQKLRQARQAGLDDRRLAYALMAIRSGHPEQAGLDEHLDLVFQLLWLLDVRAPGLDPRWLVKGVLLTDKVYWEVVSSGQLLEALADLERAATAEHQDLEAWLERPTDDPPLDRIRAAAARPERILGASGPELRERILSDLARVQASVTEGDLLERDSILPHGL